MFGMAKYSKSISFKNAVIDMSTRTITEEMKDDVRTFSLDKLLRDWDGIEGISILIKKDEEVIGEGEES